MGDVGELGFRVSLAARMLSASGGAFATARSMAAV
jgi:hypothetical protein